MVAAEPPRLEAPPPKAPPHSGAPATTVGSDHHSVAVKLATSGATEHPAGVTPARK